MDEHCRAVPQPAGDVRVFLVAVLYRFKAGHQPLPRDPRRGPPGRGARILRT